MSTQTALRATVTPHVNLLPPEIAEEARFRSLRVIMVMVVAFAAFLGGVLYLQSAGEVTAAQEQLDSAKSDGAGLQVKVNKLANVPAVYAAVAAADGQLSAAMGSEVRYSFLLNDLSLSINKNVWLTSMSVSQNDPTASASGASVPVQGPAWTKPAIGKLTFSGRATSYNDVAAWLDFLSSGKIYSDPFVSSTSASDPIGSTKTVIFESSVNLTDKAYTHRFDSKGGN
jgi:Tfp pilus assembly protein PilN